MNKKTKKKLCWNCEGSASLEDENCPYCGVYLNPLSIGGSDQQSNSLFAPPYKFSDDEDLEVPASPFADEKIEKIPAAISQTALKDVVQSKDEDLKSVILPLVFLLSGSMLFLFGTALLLFSNKGTFTLSWNASYWFCYFILSIPFLFFGWKALDHLSNSQTE